MNTIKKGGNGRFTATVNLENFRDFFLCSYLHKYLHFTGRNCFRSPWRVLVSIHAINRERPCACHLREYAVLSETAWGIVVAAQGKLTRQGNRSNSIGLDHRGSARYLRCLLRNRSSTLSFSTNSQAPRPVPCTPSAPQDSKQSSLTDLQSFWNQQGAKYRLEAISPLLFPRFSHVLHQR